MGRSVRGLLRHRAGADGIRFAPKTAAERGFTAGTGAGLSGCRSSAALLAGTGAGLGAGTHAADLPFLCLADGGHAAADPVFPAGEAAVGLVGGGMGLRGAVRAGRHHQYRAGGLFYLDRRPSGAVAVAGLFIDLQ